MKGGGTIITRVISVEARRKKGAMMRAVRRG